MGHRCGVVHLCMLIYLYSSNIIQVFYYSKYKTVTLIAREVVNAIFIS